MIISVKKELVRINQKDVLPVKQSQRLAAQREISQPVFPEREVVPQTEPTPRKRTGTKDIMQPKIKVTRLEDIVSDDAPG